MCKLKKVVITISFIIGCNILVFAQPASNEKSSAFSLKQAVDYAIGHNFSNLNADIDVQMSVAKKNEVRGIGFPQISASLDIKDYEKIPTQLIPGEFFGRPPGTYIPVQFGTQYNASGALQASQILFSSDYIVALQTTKTFLELSQKNAQRTKIETTVAVSKAYYSVLINRERIKLLEANIQRIKKLFEDTKTLNENGFVEKIDVDRVEVAYNNLVSEKEKINRLILISESLLKFQMGMDVANPIALTDSLNFHEIPQLADTSVLGKFDFNKRIEYSLLLNQRKLYELDLKRNRMGYLPSLVAYGSLMTQAQRNEFDFLDFEKKWYPIGVIGVTLQVPIFDGLQKNYRLQQSKLNILKTQNMVSGTENAIRLELSTSVTIYQNSIQSLTTQKKNMELAEGIFEVSKKKYDQGVGSNLEVMNAETSLKEAQTNYFNALYEYYVAKVDLEKAKGEIK